MVVQRDELAEFVFVIHLVSFIQRTARPGGILAHSGSGRIQYETAAESKPSERCHIADSAALSQGASRRRD